MSPNRQAMQTVPMTAGGKTGLSSSGEKQQGLVYLASQN